jgi:3-deoxy-D-manno-octulosonate 8-phosphate phosphatase (KDO 8-P phosphatase)
MPTIYPNPFDHIPTGILDKMRQVELVIFDVDGVLTDGRLYYDNHGNEFKAFHAKDGHGMKTLQRSGIPIAIITARGSLLVENRMKDLEIAHVFQNSRDKLRVFQQLIHTLGISPEAVCYVGDDLLDLPVMRQVGLAIGVKDAHFSIQQQAHWLTQVTGGQGAAREVCDAILHAQGKLASILASYGYAEA